jgi:hypothetical protein
VPTPGSRARRGRGLVRPPRRRAPARSEAAARGTSDHQPVPRRQPPSPCCPREDWRGLSAQRCPRPPNPQWSPGQQSVSVPAVATRAQQPPTCRRHERQVCRVDSDRATRCLSASRARTLGHWWYAAGCSRLRSVPSKRPRPRTYGYVRSCRPRWPAGPMGSPRRARPRARSWPRTRGSVGPCPCSEPASGRRVRMGRR